MRKEYNENVLEKCIELLQSCDPSEIFEGVVLSAYLIEQSLKHELRRINPLLYFDKKGISDEMEVRIAIGKLSKEEFGRLKTGSARRCIAQMCEYKDELTPHKANLEELFEIRNFILHSIDDISIHENSAAETAVSALRSCRKYIVRHFGVSADKFDPLTSAEFEKLQERRHNERINYLKAVLREHKKVLKKLNQSEISQKIRTNLPKTDSQTWIEETVGCPACNQLSLDKVGFVDFDWNPDGMLMGGGFYYQCRVCELEVSEYEYEIAGEF